MKLPRRRLSVEELENAVGIERTEERRPTSSDIDERTRKVLGPLWGHKRRKMEGWPR